jgi:glycosyltransferase involved in cell wall biosynthesis
MPDTRIQQDDPRALIVELADSPNDDGAEAIRAALAREGENPRNLVVYLSCSQPSGCRLAEIASSFEQVRGVIDPRDTSGWLRLLNSFGADGIRGVAFSPALADFNQPNWCGMPVHEPALKIGLPRLELPSATAEEHDLAAIGWIASTPLIGLMLEHGIGVSFNASEVVRSLLASPIELLWISSISVATQETAAANEPILNRDSKVLAIVPHYRCEEWLFRCLRSLTRQTRPPDAIVVIDDASESPPRDIVAGYPEVTLLQARENTGPYNLVQTVIDSTNYDAYLFQDADDWSTRDRLDLLLEAAAHTGAELIGTQEIRFHTQTGKIDPVCYPMDVNRALSERLGHPLLHPTSLAARSLIRRIGGFATGLRFGGDTELLRRAGYAGRIVNIPQFCYVRRVRPFSLTTDASTGFGSSDRLRLRDELDRRAEANRTRMIQGQAPILSPCRIAPAVGFDHILGPELIGEPAGRSPGSIA